MKNRTITLSVLLNLVLGAALVRTFVTRPALEIPLPPPNDAAGPGAAMPAAAAPAAPFVINPAMTNFHWSQVESADFTYQPSGSATSRSGWN